jgi:membrane protein
MATAKIAQSLAMLRQQAIRRWRQFDERTDGWISLVGRAAERAMAPGSVTIAAAMAYYAIFSIFPLALLGVAIASNSLGPLLDRAAIVRQIEFILPSVGQLLGANLDAIVRARGPVTVAAVVGLLWSASSMIYMLTGTLSQVWEIKKRRAVWKRRGLAILVVLVFVGPLLLVASFADSLLSNLITWVPEVILPLVGGISALMAILLDIILFLALYLILPHSAARWRELLPGASAAGLLWELAKKAFLLFVTRYISASNLIYGSVAAMIATMTWAYLSGLIFLFGAYLGVGISRRREREAAEAAEKG